MYEKWVSIRTLQLHNYMHVRIPYLWQAVKIYQNACIAIHILLGVHALS